MATIKDEGMKDMTLINDDFRNAVPTLSTQGVKVDLVLTDLPFGTTQCSWDVVIEPADVWKAIDMVTRDNTPILLHGAEPFSSIMRVSNLQYYKYDWIWDKVKGTSFYNAKKQPMRNHENVMVFYKKQCFYSPQMTHGHELKASYRRIEHKSECYGDSTADTHYSSTSRYPRSIQVFSSDTQTSSLHPTQKPVSLLEYFILTYTKAGDTVLDLTMGSGSTGEACHNTGRKFIGIEKEFSIFQTAKNRLETHCSQKRLFAS